MFAFPEGMEVGVAEVALLETTTAGEDTVTDCDTWLASAAENGEGAAGALYDFDESKCEDDTATTFEGMATAGGTEVEDA